MSTWSTWSYNLNGQPGGPAETTELQNLLRNGKLAPDALVWKQGIINASFGACKPLPLIGHFRLIQ